MIFIFQVVKIKIKNKLKIMIVNLIQNGYNK